MFQRILLTAIGSFSGLYVIRQLKAGRHYVLGTDIFPCEWHHASRECDAFAQVPKALHEDYVPTLLRLCREHTIDCILPLTDPEVDALNLHRDTFCASGIHLLMPESHALRIARNKLSLCNAFLNDSSMRVPRFSASADIAQWGDKAPVDMIAKPIYGRSSEGLISISQGTDLAPLGCLRDYIVQEKLEGDIVTIDYIRDRHGNDVAIPRVELLRTKNGAGTTVRLFIDPQLSSSASHIGQRLDILGCVNMEFILHNGTPYLIDINPRFSAGVAFSGFAHYDMVLNHLKCHRGEPIENIGTYREQILEKIHSETCNATF